MTPMKAAWPVIMSLSQPRFGDRTRDMSGGAVGREVLGQRDVHRLGIVVEESQDHCGADRAAIEPRQIEKRSALRAECHADLEASMGMARESGELKDDADPAALAVLASATLHSIAIRARAGVPRNELREIARKAVRVICG
jgi:hypothetical protein